jgi:hypothetical protein
MNNTEPRVSDVAAFENDLRKHLVQLLFYNSQASDAAAQRMVRIARQAKVPVVAVTETEPLRCSRWTSSPLPSPNSEPERRQRPAGLCNDRLSSPLRRIQAALL